MRAQYTAGATVAAACSGAVLLARTGLLDGLEATSHWGYCDALQREYPTTRWRPEHPLVVAGEGQRIVMAGSGTSWHTLALFLIARFVGPEEAMQAARINVLDWNPISPVAYASLARNAQVADTHGWALPGMGGPALQRGIPGRPDGQLSGLPERTFKRRFTQAMGMPPLEYVHTLRLEEAKQMLESGNAAVEAIAGEVGYQDASFSEGCSGARSGSRGS